MRETITLSKRYLFSRMVLYFLSFVIPFAILIMSMIALHINPFGEHNLAISDAKYYINNEIFFSRLLKGQENWLYSLNNGIGGNNWSVLAWGYVSFGSLLSVFGTLETMPSLFTWICIVNLSLCGLTMYTLLDCVNKNRISNLLFSTSYAFIGFNIVNIYQIGFALGPEVLPLIILGIIMLFRGKSPLLYIFSLSFCTFFNFYFAFHLCVISFLFYLGYVYVNSESLQGSHKKLFSKWLISSLLGGLLAAPVWLPTLKAFSGGGRLNQTSFSEYSFRENMPFIQIFSKLFTGANSTNELVSGLPNIFCGILVVALVILYFMNKSIPMKKKRAAGIILGVYLISFYIQAFNLVMHGGTHTNWFPYRYSYVFSFILICLAAEEFINIDKITIQDTKKCGVVLLIITILVFSTSYEFISGGSVLLDLALLLAMWVGFWFYKTRPDKAPLRTFSLLLLILVSINLYANTIISTSKVKEWELDLDEYSKNVMVSGALTEALNKSETGFFRMEKDKSESGSVAADPLQYNYNGVSHSGPAERMFIHQGLCKLGINWFDMRHWYSKGIPAATDSLLGLKYLISKKDLSEEKGYEEKIELDGYKIFFNPNALNLSILSEDDIQDLELGDDVFSNLNQVWKKMTGESVDVFTEQEEVKYTLHNDYSNQSVTSIELRESTTANASKTKNSDHSDVSGEGTLKDRMGIEEDDEGEDTSSYILYTFNAKQDGPIYVFDTSIPESDYGLAEPAIKYVGTYKEGDIVEGKFPIDAGIGSGDLMRGYCTNMVFAYANNDILAEYADTLNGRDITLNVVHENDLKGTYTADKDQRILFTLPWDEGWMCLIDGEKVNINKTWDLFMSVKVPEGKHTFEMKFIPAWLNYGIILSAVAFVGLILFMIYRGKHII